ncbi:hypothetical protein GCM10010191_53690 [Actinomadura vinacea]|uniref:Uncharacterized protein n=1 Tax=Actinomadura vinacea TaxID=115336 RepID=A0ABN3JMX4_9ACTN
MRDDPGEPVFVRSKWGANNYVFNWRNPVGRVLIVVTLLAAIVVLGSLYAS